MCSDGRTLFLLYFALFLGGFFIPILLRILSSVAHLLVHVLSSTSVVNGEMNLRNSFNAEICRFVVVKYQGFSSLRLRMGNFRTSGINSGCIGFFCGVAFSVGEHHVFCDDIFTGKWA